MKIIVLSSELRSTSDLKVTIMLIFRDPSRYSLGRSKHTYYCNCRILNTYRTFRRLAADCQAQSDIFSTNTVPQAIWQSIMLIFRDPSGYSLGRSKHTFYCNTKSVTTSDKVNGAWNLGQGYRVKVHGCRVITNDYYARFYNPNYHSYRKTHFSVCNVTT